MLTGKTVLLGVSGGIAAYKAVDVASRLRKLNAQVHVIMTRNAAKLVGPVTFRTISGNPVHVEMFEEPKRWNVEHIALASRADLFLLCPGTANAIGKIASGIADDFLTTVVMACTSPKLICPAMNTNMYENPAVQANLETLRSWGYHVMEPESGRLASGAVGKGRLPEPAAIVNAALGILRPCRDLENVRVLVTAGPTREWIDPVRFISPPSTGKMGYALAQAARDRGADVILVSGPVNIEPPAGVQVVQVETTSEMLEACLSAYPKIQVVIGAAAPSDFRPVDRKAGKMKKKGHTINIVFEETEDILATLGRQKDDRILVGFAAETSNLVEYARQKMDSKNLDFVCANRVDLADRGFGSGSNAVTLVHRDGGIEEIPLAPKYDVAWAILDRVRNILIERSGK